ncbi:MAG: TlpA family protein disulfide reductase [Gemmatimonadetes bacterium]|uniref:TlpA family protein disulfide reductase n=1 Tax=Candidatus Kutchimonas denitrificans TaxID=3056748 RepID=A0AAE5C9I8_9BACT|nr:TlpA family protein disulfide reductase [Gemmatimonadota bacterium]NIR75526.1 TlpA family protein disulfide reductase [Candidatus Kutchimonas denitrificans]NIS01840.1 TlpA family protein disulfide reductase [Gemmatimonadota bacterium]NIT67621.1 TlpA family protein disulfide reductase [Gemmatimonadota bacterium]NIU53495.1 redoxin domain-containing protein [Gemmatimonadota bacterium]
MNKTLKVLGAILVVGSAIVAGLLLGGSADDPSGVEVTDRVPEYEAPNLSGEPVSFADHRGEVVLVNVWATWCGPCRIEMPSIQALYDRYRERGFTVLAVSVDVGPNHREKVIEFLEEEGLELPVLLDPEGRIMRTLQTVGVPETFVLDREGRIAKRLIGATNWDSEANRALIEQLLQM